MCCTDDDVPYKPNKYTRYINARDWWNFILGKANQIRMVNPGYVNEPHEEPRKAALTPTQRTNP
jgi:hypothetical protein